MGALQAGVCVPWTAPRARGEAGGLGTEAARQRPPRERGLVGAVSPTHLRQPRPRWLSWSWARPERALLTEETVEAPRVMRMRPLSSKRAVLL